MEFGLNLNVIIVRKKMKKNIHTIIKAKPIFVIESAKESIIEISHFGKHQITEELEKLGTINGFIMLDIESRTLNEYHILKQEDMPDKETRKGNILLMNGKNYAENSNGNVLFAERKRNSQKTILNLFRLVGQIISQTFSHFVAPVIVVNGKSFMRPQNY